MQQQNVALIARMSALTQLNQVKREIADASKTAANLPTIQRQYVELARDVAVTTQLYTSVLTTRGSSKSPPPARRWAWPWWNGP